jgi:tetratricopeptide (TPR) repeat protein
MWCVSGAPDRGAGSNLPQLLPKIYGTEMKRTRRCVYAWAAALACGFLAASPAPAQQKVAPPAQQHPAPGARPPRAAPEDTTPQKVSIETSQQLFATMCALWAVDYDSEAATASLPPAWRGIAEQMYQLKGPAVDTLRAYYQKHEHHDPSVTLTRFISFAMVVGPPPDFKYTLRHDDLPPDVLTIEDFTDVLAKFCQEAQIDRIWRRIEPAYQLPTQLLLGPMTKIVLQTTGYLRELLASDSPRTFTIYIEPLVRTDTNFRNYGYQYDFILNGDADPPLTDLRHAFLHFLLDTIPARYPAAIAPSRPLIQLALKAPQLPAQYHDESVAFYTECLIKAVELRLDHLQPAKLAAALDQDDVQGYVLVRPLFAGLEQFQQAEPAMKFYFPALAKSVDVAAETKRVAAIQFAPSSEPAPLTSAEQEANEKEEMLRRGEQFIASQDGASAQAQFERVLAHWPDTARAQYGLAIAAVLQGQGQKAEDMFTALVQPPSNGTPAPDASVLAWSHVYLGRIYDMKSDRDQAVTEYRAALAVTGVPASARAAAQNGLQKPYQPAQKEDHPGAH